MASGEIKREPQITSKYYTVTTGSSPHYDWYWVNIELGNEIDNVIGAIPMETLHNRQILIQRPSYSTVLRVMSNEKNDVVTIKVFFKT